MTTLRDPFPVVHQKEIKKGGVVVAVVDYVGWSQVADRLDDVAPGWDFEIVKLEDDWCWGRLTVGGSRFDNVGYAENADADWKKEPLKDAVSDALKRCAAMAGVARYLYDKDAPSGQRTSSPRPQQAPPVAPPAAGDEPPWPTADDISAGEYPIPARPGPFAPLPRVPETDGVCPEHHLAWVLKPGGVSKRSGKEYSPFWTCAHKGPPFCDNKPSKAWQAQHETAA